VAADVRLLPFCTAVGQPGCVTPCPTCGDGVMTFPETCDPGVPSACCDATCRTVACGDGDACTTDACVEPIGCVHTPIPGCGTTTTTVPATTTTTTTSLVTTTSVVSTSTTSTIVTGTTLPGCLGDGDTCNDGDECTRDRCGDDGVCRHDEIPGLDGALCRIDAVATIIRGGPAPLLGGAHVQTRLRKQVEQLRGRVASARSGGRRGAKALARARRQLAAFLLSVDRGERAGKIDHDVARRLRALGLDAQGDLTP
jgi:hypothetical protein